MPSEWPSPPRPPHTCCFEPKAAPGRRDGGVKASCAFGPNQKWSMNWDSGHQWTIVWAVEGRLFGAGPGTFANPSSFSLSLSSCRSKSRRSSDFCRGCLMVTNPSNKTAIMWRAVLYFTAALLKKQGGWCRQAVADSGGRGPPRMIGGRP